MDYEVKNHINWFVVLTDVFFSSLPMSISTFFGRYENLMINLVTTMIILVLVTLWRMQSYKIVVDEKIYFKRLLLQDYRISFDEIKSIKFYDDIKPRLLSLKRAFIEIDTKDRYFTYYLDHFDLKEIKELLVHLEEKYAVQSIINERTS